MEDEKKLSELLFFFRYQRLQSGLASGNVSRPFLLFELAKQAFITQSFSSISSFFFSF